MKRTTLTMRLAAEKTSQAHNTALRTLISEMQKPTLPDVDRAHLRSALLAHADVLDALATEARTAAQKIPA